MREDGSLQRPRASKGPAVPMEPTLSPSGWRYTSLQAESWHRGAWLRWKGKGGGL